MFEFDFVQLINPSSLFYFIIFCFCFYLLRDYILDWGYFLVVDQHSNTRGYRQDRHSRLIRQSDDHVVFHRTYWKRSQYLQEIHSKCFIEVNGIFGGPLAPSQLYIRPCYKDLYSYLLSQNNKSGTLVTGSPGIGKSCFLVYALARRLMEGKTTILSDSTSTVLFDDRGVWKLDRTPPPSDLQLEEGDDFVWCLYDGVNPPFPAFFSVHCFLVHVTSPEVSRYKEWTKQVGAKEWYMDVWTKAEFRESMRLRGEECDDEELENRMSAYGPCPRDHIGDTMILKQLVIRAIQVIATDSSKWKDIALFGFHSSDLTLSDKVFILRARADHEKCKIAFKAPWMKTRMLQACDTAQAENIREFYKQYFRIEETSILCAWMFEHHAMNVMSRGNRTFLKQCFQMTSVSSLSDSRAFARRVGDRSDCSHLPNFSERTIAYQNSTKTFYLLEDFEPIASLHDTSPRIDISKWYYVPASSRNPLFDAFFFERINDQTVVIWVVHISTDVTSKKPGSPRGYTVLKKIRESLEFAEAVKFKFMFVVPAHTQNGDVRFELPADGDNDTWPYDSDTEVYVQFVEI